MRSLVVSFQGKRLPKTRLKCLRTSSLLPKRTMKEPPLGRSFQERSWGGEGGGSPNKPLTSLPLPSLLPSPHEKGTTCLADLPPASVCTRLGRERLRFGAAAWTNDRSGHGQRADFFWVSTRGFHKNSSDGRNPEADSRILWASGSPWVEEIGFCLVAQVPAM